jgi:tRNA 2-selenouridine synthase
VVTGADPARRIVHQINAEPAALEYARILGKDPAQMTPFTFAAHPVLVRVGGQHYVRSIRQVAENDELVFFSAIDEGLVLTLAEASKTRVIAALDRAIDLEQLARHRGSSFGHLPEAQPSQIDFENALSIGFLQLLQRGDGPVVLEDEGRLIGRLALPENLRQRMQGAPMLAVEESLAERVQVILEDYVVDLGERYSASEGLLEGPALHRTRLLEGLDRIRKRLGGERHQAIRTQMEKAFAQQRASGEVDEHRAWISALLETYYDPMYSYQLAQRGGDILFQGCRDEVIRFARAGLSC